MKYFCAPIILLLVLSGCEKKLEFETQVFRETTTLPCKDPCPEVTVSIPVAKNTAVADSINDRVFEVLKEIIYFGEKPYKANTYDQLLKSFIGSYDQMKNDFPEDIFGWNAKIDGSVLYRSENIINLDIQHYTFTGGAHGYGGRRSLIFDVTTGQQLNHKMLFNDVAAFTKFAEQRFRRQYNIAPSVEINSGGLMFEGEKFALPQNIFYTDKGLLLLYNAYEIASYAEGSQQLMIPYSELQDYLKIR